MALLKRSTATTEASQELAQGLTDVRGSVGASLGVAASAGEFGLEVGGWGTGGVMLVGENASGVTKTSDGTLIAVLPQNYEAGSSIVVNVESRTSVVVASGSTLDLQAYKSDDQGGVGSDLVATSAININSATWATAAFTITGTSLNPGDRLELYFQSVVNDATGSNNGRCEIGAIDLVTTTRM